MRKGNEERREDVVVAAVGRGGACWVPS